MPEECVSDFIRFFTLENVTGREIHIKMCVVCGMQKVIAKSTVEPMGTEIQDGNKYEQKTSKW